MNLTLVETSHNNSGFQNKFLSLWIDDKLVNGSNDESIFDWVKGFESGLEYLNATYDKNFLFYSTDNEEAFYPTCDVTRATSLDQYIARLEKAGLVCEEDKDSE